MYIRPDLEKVPVERLVTNLEAAVKKDPKDVKSLVNLSRVHAMAYALKTDTADIRKGKEADGPWFGYEPKYVPFEKVASPAESSDRSAQHGALGVAYLRAQ